MALLRGLVAVVVLAVAVAGCRPSQPSPADWHQQASQSLEDLASEVSTAEIVLRAETRDRLLGRSGIVMLVDAEETAGTTVESFTSLQPPDALARRHAEVIDALEHASGLVTEARSVRVRADEAAYEELIRSLAEEQASLTELAGRVR